VAAGGWRVLGWEVRGLRVCVGRLVVVAGVVCGGWSGGERRSISTAGKLWGTGAVGRWTFLTACRTQCDRQKGSDDYSRSRLGNLLRGARRQMRDWRRLLQAM